MKPRPIRTLDSTFREQIDSFAQRIRDLHQRSLCLSASADDIVKEAFQELEVSLHELQISQDELRHQNEALMEQRRRYEELFDFAPDAYLVTSADGIITEANRAAVKLLGVRREYLTDKPFAVYLDPRERDSFRTRLNRLKQEHPADAAAQPEEWETAVRGRASPSVAVVISYSVLYDAQGRLSAVRWLIRDVRERKRVENELAASRRELRELSAHLQTAREEERAHVAREIHDELGQALTGLKLQLTWIDRRLTKDSAVVLQEKIHSMLEQIDGTIDVVRNLATALRPTGLDDLGLQATIEWHIGEFRKRTGIAVHLDLAPAGLRLSKDCQVALFRIYQEALTNVCRHADAKTVWIRLNEADGRVVLKVMDDGRGIAKEQATGSGTFGIIGMRERALQWGGTLEITRMQHGTKVTARIPVTPIVASDQAPA